MKNSILGTAMVAALGVTAAPAFAQTGYGDVAQVISATPVTERVSVPRSVCHTEEVRAPDPGAIGAGTVLGAVVGGVIGHQFGSSTGGRDHATAAGAVVGGLVGNAIARDAQAEYRTASSVERCDTVPESRERIVGYDVRYQYNGREFRARLPYDPGQEMPVNVEVIPPGANTSLTGPRRPVYRGTY